MNRNYNDSRYTEWRQLVRKRAKGRCQLCGSKRQCQAHHIIRYADSPALRFSPANGCLLCRKCHTRVTGSEAGYRSLLTALANGPHFLAVRLQRMIDEAREEQGG